MNSFWKILKQLIESVNAVETADEMLELDFESDSSQSHLYATFHTNADGNLVMSVFDNDQWSLVQDMSSFLDKSIENIVRELDPTSPNIFVLDSDEIESGPR